MITKTQFNNLDKRSKIIAIKNLYKTLKNQFKNWNEIQDFVDFMGVPYLKEMKSIIDNR